METKMKKMQLFKFMSVESRGAEGAFGIGFTGFIIRICNLISWVL